MSETRPSTRRRLVGLACLDRSTLGIACALAAFLILVSFGGSPLVLALGLVTLLVVD